MDKQKENGALLIAASIVAAIRLRGEEIKPSPKLNAVIYDAGKPFKPTPHSGELMPSALADKSDSWVKALIVKLASLGASGA